MTTDSMTSEARNQAEEHMQSIVEMVAALDVDYDRLEDLNELVDTCRLSTSELAERAELEAAADGCMDRDDAEQQIEEYALSIEVRSNRNTDWYTLGEPGEPGKPSEPGEFRIVLCTGETHIQIRGELREGRPWRAWRMPGTLEPASTVKRAFYLWVPYFIY